MAFTGTASTGWSLSAGVHQRPPKTGWVVTQFVTQLDAGGADRLLRAAPVANLT
jgi:hypothetical protein